MKQEMLNEALYNKYIAPTHEPRSSSIGIEIELPVVELSGKAVDENAVISAADKFREHFSFVRLNGKEVYKGERHKGIFIPTLEYITALDAMNI